MTAPATHSQRGMVTIEFLLGIAFIMVPVVFLVTALPTWSERHSMSVTASREAARAAAEADTEAEARDRARLAAEQVIRNSGFPDAEIPQVMEPPVVNFPSGFVRGGTVEVNVSIVIPALVIPFWDAATDAATVGSITSRSVQKIDQFRSFG